MKPWLSNLVPLFLLLLSYETVLLLSPLTEMQEETISVLRWGNPASLSYTALEQAHLSDVQKVMWGADYLFLAILAVLFVVIISFAYSLKNDLWKKINWEEILSAGGKKTLFLGLILLILVVMMFPFTFTAFHAFFFPQGNWQFPADSLLIATFPETFFQMIAFFIFLLAMLLGLVLWKGKKMWEKVSERLLIK